MCIHCELFEYLFTLQWKPSEGVADCFRVDMGDNPYEPGQAIGAGLKSELWKGNHSNLTILETGEDTPVLVSAGDFQ